jgi:hypothetical protein
LFNFYTFSTNVISNPSVYNITDVFYDTLHMTEEVHSVLAEQCFDLITTSSSEIHKHQVDTSQQPQFVATGITLMSFAYNGNLCLGNSTGGLPKSISLYVSGYSDAVGVISVLGELDSNEISLEVVDDIYLSNGVPSMQGNCLKGTISNDRCDLTEN